MELIRLIDLQAMPWQPHPTVAGILTKIIESRATNALGDALLGQVLPGGAIPWHIHENASETAYFVQGLGKLLYAPNETERDAPLEVMIMPGCALTVQAGVWHSVLNTSAEPMIIFAFHTPPTF